MRLSKTARLLSAASIAASMVFGAGVSMAQVPTMTSGFIQNQGGQVGTTSVGQGAQVGTSPMTQGALFGTGVGTQGAQQVPTVSRQGTSSTSQQPAGQPSLSQRAIESVNNPTTGAIEAPKQRIPTLPPPDAVPPTIDMIQSLRQSSTSGESGEMKEIRAEALRDAARSLGARSGLARRTWEITEQLRPLERSLNNIFDFRAILYRTEGSAWLIPPIISEADAAFVVSGDRQSSAEADKVYRILRNATLSAAPPEWRGYLIQAWEMPSLPPEALRPKNDNETAAWKAWVGEGWNAGVRQADEIFEENLNRLERDFIGMVQYGVLLSQGIIEPPTVAAANRGVVGDPNTNMRIGDRVVRIVTPGRLNTQFQNWQSTPIQTDRGGRIIPMPQPIIGEKLPAPIAPAMSPQAPALQAPQGLRARPISPPDRRDVR